MITISFENRGESGLCEYLYSSIKDQVLKGQLKPDEKLPSKRTLAENLGVSVITVQNAYAQLISEGYIYSIEKKGFFVTDLTVGSGEFSAKTNQRTVVSVAEENSEQDKKDWFIDFRSNSTGYEKFPFALWSHTMRQVLNSGDEKLLQRVDVKGVFDLRRAISNYLREFRNMEVSPGQIVVGAGTENLYSMAVQLLGREKIFAVEDPGYHKVASVFESNGAAAVPVKIDGQGINPEDLEKVHADVVHVSPSHHFPTGIVMPVRRRHELLNWVQRSERRFIIEDDYDSEFRFNGKPLPTLQSADQFGKVIYINTFSKTLAPSFRLSYMVLPESLVSVFENKFKGYSCPVSSFEQYTLAQFIDQGYFGKHIIRMKNYYRNLRNNLIGALENSSLSKVCKICEEEAGLHFLLSVDSEKTKEQLVERLLEQGINLPLLNGFYYGEAPVSEEKTFVVNYSGIKKERIGETVRRLEMVFK